MNSSTKQTEVSASKLALDAKKIVPSDGTLTLSTGYRVKIIPVAASLIDDVVSQIKDPPVPMWHNEDKNRDEPNPGDPDYLRKLTELDKKRALAGIEVLLVFGVEMLDPIPDDDTWLNKLTALQRKGLLNLDEYDLDNPEDKAFLFKKYIAVGVDDLTLISKISGLSKDDVVAATDSFQR